MSDHVLAHLSVYLDGEIEAAERLAVEAHLGVCDECARHLEDLAAVDELARALPLEAPSGYFEALPGRVRFKVTARTRRPTRLPAWSWAVAAALLVAVVTPALLRQNPRPAEVTRSAPVPASALPAEPADLEGQAAPAKRIAAPLAGSPAEREQKASSYDETTARQKETPAQAPSAAPAAPAPAVGYAQGSLARNDAGAPLAKAEEATGKDKLREAAPSQPGGTPSTPAPSGAFARAPEASAVEGAAGQHLYEPKVEADATDAPAPAAEEARRTRPLAGPDPALRDADAVRSEPAGKSEPSAPRLRFRALRGESAESVEDARRLREQWRAFVAQGPAAWQADEARVRIVEMGVTAWRLSNDPADLVLAKRDAEAYLRRDDAAQGDRVRLLLSTVGN